MSRDKLRSFGISEDELDDLEKLAAALQSWPNCTTPDCHNKQCTWSGVPLCFPCAEKVHGLPWLIERYNETHEYSWEVSALMSESDPEFVNPVVKL